MTAIERYLERGNEHTIVMRLQSERRMQCLLETEVKNVTGAQQLEI